MHVVPDTHKTWRYPGGDTVIPISPGSPLSKHKQRNQTSTVRKREEDDFVPAGENVCRYNYAIFILIMDVFIESFSLKIMEAICVIFDLTPFLYYRISFYDKNK